MSGETMLDLLDFALEVSWKAGKSTLAYYQTSVEAELKADASPVTVADREAERIVREVVTRRFPQDGVLGEELGELRGSSGRRWIVDPIDGTQSFVHGVPLYGVLLALEEEAESLLGVLHFPALGETIYAARGEGCWWNGRHTTVSGTADLGEAVVLTSGIEYVLKAGRMEDWHRVAERARVVRTWGDCYGYALVATGRADVMLDPIVSIWDAAALAPVIEEAGGVFSDWQGRRSHRSGSAVATNAPLDGPVRALLAPPPEKPAETEQSQADGGDA